MKATKILLFAAGMLVLVGVASRRAEQSDRYAEQKGEGATPVRMAVLESRGQGGEADAQIQGRAGQRASLVSVRDERRSGPMRGKLRTNLPAPRETDPESRSDSLDGMAMESRKNAPDAPCVTTDCHGDMREAKFLHKPVAISACAACHRSSARTPEGRKAANIPGPPSVPVVLSPIVTDKPTTDERPKRKRLFTLTKHGNGLCYFCHTRFDIARVVHEPLKKEPCTTCHDPHKSPNRFLLTRSTIAETCYKCHKEDIENEGEHVHEPAASGECTACHDAHSSRNKGLLVATGNDLCFRCHEETQLELSRLKYKHAAVEDCSQCHSRHASSQKALLKKPAPDLCADCHVEHVMRIETAPTQHSAVTTGRKCLNCHEPHGANHPHGLKGPPNSLCMTCHDKEIKTPTREIINVKAELAQYSNHHGPVREGKCIPCHDIHGADFSGLLKKAYPSELYASFAVESYALCFQCHERALALDEHTRSETDFRNGDLNLHYLHTHKEAKGRTCRACHRVHASNNSKHIKDWVPLGPMGRDLPMRFQKTETGGSCAPACHPSRSYDRIAPAAYPW